MRTYLKTILAVTGGVAGVGGGAVGLALRKTRTQGTFAGGGDTTLVSSSETGDTREIAESSTSSESEDTYNESSTPELSLTQDTEPAQRDEVTVSVTPVKEEEKENCEIIDFSRLADVFYNLVENDKYILISCKGTNKDASDKFSKKWKGLFPDYLFLNKGQVKKFELTTETLGSGENIQIVFSSEQFSFPITGKWGDISQDPEETFRVQEIDFREPKTGKIFFFLIENIDLLRKNN